MAVVVNQVRLSFYLDSVALMRLTQIISRLPGVETAALMIGSVANRRILDNAQLLVAEGRSASANDLVIAVRATSAAEAESALTTANEFLQRPGPTESGAARYRSRSLAGALSTFNGANLALISIPGEFAAAEASKALARGLHVMIFSANVTHEDERALKLEAQRRGLLVMGPDCGTSLIGGVPLAFANEVARGDIGIVAASGTGLQEVSCLIARAGGGVSHGIGTGGRDLSEKIGALTTLAAIDALDSDPTTARIILISKPPSKDVAETVLERVAQCRKRFTICFLGAPAMLMPANARAAATLADAASDALDGKAAWSSSDLSVQASAAKRQLDQKRRWIRGLYSGGTLCAEAQVVLRNNGGRFWSNAPVSGALPSRPEVGNILIDYGAEEYTIGKPHPMIDPTRRNQGLVEALQDPLIAVVLVDVVIGHGAHGNPAGAMVERLDSVVTRGPAIVASVTGTDHDPQNRTAQVRILEQAGILVAESNAEAAQLALEITRPS